MTNFEYFFKVRKSFKYIFLDAVLILIVGDGTRCFCGSTILQRQLLRSGKYETVPNHGGEEMDGVPAALGVEGSSQTRGKSNITLNMRGFCKKR